MTLPVVFTANGPSGYNLTKSLRFRSSASAYLNRTPASSGSQTTFTWSGWVKRGTLGVRQSVFSSGASNSNALDIYFTSSDTLTFEEYNGTNYYNRTSAVYRDPSAWYHIVVAVDSTQATSSDRVKMYVNGSQITAFSTALYPTQNFAYQINTASYPARISNGTLYASEYFDGYQAEVNFIDGQQLTPSSFGSTNPATGVWQPAQYTGTYGTNGFYLPFTNTTSTTTIGYDFSGNSNNWTSNNISLTTGATYDSMTDVPTLTNATTANYAVLNPVNPPTGAVGLTYTNGNLNLATVNSGAPPTESSALSTIYFPSSGKFYAEMTVGTTLGTTSNAWPRFGVAGYGMGIGGYVNFGGSSYGTFTTGDIMSVAWDVATGKIWWGKNGTWLNSGDPAAGTGNISTFTYDSASAYVQLTLFYSTTGSTGSVNFGQQGFTYTPPTNFVALNTYNLPTSTIVKGNTVMDATLYAGTSVAQSITNAAGFKPDLVWGKNRTSINSHRLTDSVRGTGIVLFSDTTNGDTTGDGQLSSFNSNGFGLTGGAGAFEGLNESGKNYVAWQWQAGQGTTSSNTSGSITSTVSVNASAGFSVVTYTGTGSTATIGHGLGVAPSMIIVKRRDAGGSGWSVYFTTLPAGYVLSLQSTGGQANSSNRFTTTLPTSSVFSVGTDSDLNTSGGTYVAYCWSEIAGFSKFGSYVGNGSTDGTFVYTGFRPKFIMVKCSSNGSTNWFILDTSRDTYNLAGQSLEPNLSNAEYTPASSGYPGDILSNGFKWRDNSNNANNYNGYTYIYMAFAENPFKNALAR